MVTGSISKSLRYLDKAYASLRALNAHENSERMLCHYQVKTELDSYDPADRFGVCDWLCWRWPMPTRGDDAKGVFDVSTSIYLSQLTVLIPTQIILLKRYEAVNARFL